MRILVISESFPPEIKSAATLFFELAESLVKNGHQVSVVTRKPCNYLAEGTDLKAVPDKEILNGINVFRQKIPNLARNIPLIRGIEHFIIGILLFFEALKQKDNDLILVYMPPLPIGVAGVWLSKIRRMPLVVNIHDLYPQTVIDLGLLKNKVLIWLSRSMETFVYRQANYFTVPFEGNRQYLIKYGVKKGIIDIVSNWADTDLIKPGSKDNEFARRHGLQDKFIVSFAGSIGFAQGLEVMILAADLLKDKPEIEFILVGDGVKKKELQLMAEGLRLRNLKFMEPQQLDTYPDVLHSSDVGLVILSKSLISPALPGKLLSIMAAGVPIVASLPLDGEAPKVINKYHCGVCVEPGSPDALARAILKLYNNKSLGAEMGLAGRKVAEKYYSRQVAAEKYERVFGTVLSQ